MKTRLGAMGVRVAMMAAIGGAVVALAGCGQALRAASGQSPGGPQRSLDMFTYESTGYLPQTVTLVDTRDQQEIWSVDIPVGQRLTVRFYDNHDGGDTTMTDRMKWVLTDASNGPRQLRNEIPCPPGWARRLDVSLRDAPEAAPESAGERTTVGS